MSRTPAISPSEPPGALSGVHHVTAVTAHARDNLAFYTTVLGMRLVKKTVNQDDTSAYHLFYADAGGHPGTDLTFFDWAMIPRGRHGPGAIVNVSLRVNGAGALEWWARHLAKASVSHEEVVARAGRASLRFTDAEGQTLTLVDDGGAAGGTPWVTPAVPEELAIRGLGPVTIMESALEPTATLLTAVMGFRRAGSYTDFTDDGAGHRRAETEITVFETGPGGVGAEVHVALRPDLGRGQVGSGGVHHVAFRTPDDEHHRLWRHHLAAAGVGVTPVIDRYYFRSIYFREPGGVLFEIATDGPGFTADEPLDSLGEQLSLPPFLEPNRHQIEARLEPLP